MRTLVHVACSIVVVVCLVACENSESVVAAVPPPQPPATQFTTFVKAQFSATSDTTDPVAVDDMDIEFSDNENTAAFDDLLQ